MLNYKIQHGFFSILTSEFESMDMLLWKRGPSNVSTEDEKLWINSKLMWFGAPRLPEDH